MPKLKNHQASAKRYIVTKTKKVKKRKSGQDHFNARENGVAGRKKRRDISLFKTDGDNIKTFIPYNK